MALIGGLLFAGASIISIANMAVPWRGALVVAALLVPITFVISGLGVWLATAQGVTQLVIGLIALPWLYGLIFVLLMVASFKL